MIDIIPTSIGYSWFKLDLLDSIECFKGSLNWPSPFPGGVSWGSSTPPHYLPVKEGYSVDIYPASQSSHPHTWKKMLV